VIGILIWDLCRVVVSICEKDSDKRLQQMIYGGVMMCIGVTCLLLVVLGVIMAEYLRIVGD
jgi:hypothetical protein